MSYAVRDELTAFLNELLPVERPRSRVTLDSIHDADEIRSLPLGEIIDADKGYSIYPYILLCPGS